jgi:hypothetical protein
MRPKSAIKEFGISKEEIFQIQKARHNNFNSHKL